MCFSRYWFLIQITFKPRFCRGFQKRFGRLALVTIQIENSNCNIHEFYLFLSHVLGPQVSSSDHILVKFPSQCVLTAEAIVRNINMTEALQSGSLRELSQLRYARSLTTFSPCYGARNSQKLLANGQPRSPWSTQLVF